MGVWDFIEDRFRKKVGLLEETVHIQGWETHVDLEHLVYFLSLFPMPKVVCSRLEKIQRDFLWSGGNLERKPHLVNWKIVCSKKKRVGLGVRNLSKINQALLCKWNWRFSIDREPIWRIVSNFKFGEMVGRWTTSDIRGGFSTGLWKEIKKTGLPYPKRC